MDGIEKIRKRANAHNASYMLPAVQTLARDVLEVLERIDELERENKELREETETAIEYRRADEW